jgi:peroxiredoxin
MTIAVGETMPDVELRTMGEDGPEAVQTGEALGKGKVLLFAVPGAFTPGCSKIHLPGYLEGSEELREKGVDTVACVSINDAWVMDAWADAQGVDGRILMLADGNGDFTKAMGLEVDLGRAGLGLRSQRYAAIIEDGVLTSLEVEPAPGVDVSSCQSMLARL